MEPDEAARLISTHSTLRDAAASLFDGLHDVPQFGAGIWENYFRRTFDAYNQLWKFQQEHRSMLEAKGALHRHQIGEIASRIGQLYYLFYLRKSDASYLDEAFTFYDFIRSRRYFEWAADPASASGIDEPRRRLALRELRYYARFALICILSGRREQLAQILSELTERSINGAATSAEQERAEWSHVLAEFHSFMQVDRPLAVAAPGSERGHGAASPAAAPSGPRLRLQPQETQRVGTAVARALATCSSGSRPQPPLALSEALLVGACASQVKLGELSIDVFRMLHAVEWDAQARKRLDAGAVEGGSRGDGSSERGDAGGSLDAVSDAAQQLMPPRKYMLHRPSAAQLLLVLSTILVEVKPHTAVMLYLSADGLHAAPRPQSASVSSAASAKGGVAMAVVATGGTTSSAEAVRACCLSPADLAPFCRMPLVLIVDSDNSHAFEALPQLAQPYGQPLLCLLAPCPVAPCHMHAREASQQLAGGGALTLFLHEPITALCALCSIPSVTPEALAVAQAALLRASDAIGIALVDALSGANPADGARSHDTAHGGELTPLRQPHAALSFVSDPFLRTALVRFLLCTAAFASLGETRDLHARGELHLPRCAPALPESLMRHPAALGAVRAIAAAVGAGAQFEQGQGADRRPSLR